MTDLRPMTSLGGGAVQTARFGALCLNERSDLGLASLAVAAQSEPPQPFGLQLPEPGKAIWAAEIGAFWTGPGQWMIEAVGKAEEDFATQVKAQAPGCAVTEQTDGFACFDLIGPTESLEDLLPKLVNIDPGSITPGTVFRTGLEHMTVMLLCRDTGHLSVFCMRSFASALWHALTEAAKRQQA